MDHIIHDSIEYHRASLMEYFSLQDISRKYGIDQDYLRVLILRKKLKAVKIGRNWVTTEEWFLEYSDRANKWKEFLKENGVPGARKKGERTVRIKKIANQNQLIQGDSMHGDSMRMREQLSNKEGYAQKNETQFPIDAEKGAIAERYFQKDTVPAAFDENFLGIPANSAPSVRYAHRETVLPGGNGKNILLRLLHDLVSRKNDFLKKIPPVTIAVSVVRWRERFSRAVGSFSQTPARAFKVQFSFAVLLLVFAGTSTGFLNQQSIGDGARSIHAYAREGRGVINGAYGGVSREVRQLAFAAHNGIGSLYAHASEIKELANNVYGGVSREVRQLAFAAHNAIVSLLDAEADIQASGIRAFKQTIQNESNRLSFATASLIDSFVSAGDAFSHNMARNIHDDVALLRSFGSFIGSAFTRTIVDGDPRALLAQEPLFADTFLTPLGRAVYEAIASAVIKTKSVLTSAVDTIIAMIAPRQKIAIAPKAPSEPLRGSSAQEETQGAQSAPQPPRDSERRDTNVISRQPIPETRQIIVSADTSSLRNEFQASLLELNLRKTKELKELASLLFSVSQKANQSQSLASNSIVMVSQAQKIDKLQNLTVTDGLTLSTGNFAVSSGNFTLSGNSTVTGGGSYGGGLSVGGAFSAATSTFTGALTLAQIATPASVTDRLYNSAGDLYWNGSVVSSASVGQWTASGGNVYRATGNVGIGTTSPASLLSVHGNGYFAGTGFFGGAITATSSAYLATAGGSVGIGSTTPWGQLSVNPNGISGPAFVVGSSTATNFIVTNVGNVGIGTTTPGTRLGVQGDIVGAGRLTVSSFTATSTTATSTISGGFEIAPDRQYAFSGNSWGNAKIVFRTDVDNKIYSDPSGNWFWTTAGKNFSFPDINAFSIASTTPGGTLSVAAATTSPAFLVNQTSTGDLLTLQDSGSTVFTVKDGGNVGIGTTGPAAKLNIVGADATQLFRVSGDNVHLAARFDSLGSGHAFLGTPNVHDLVFTTSDVGRITILAAGNVGIGTTSPGSLLHLSKTTAADTDLRFESQNYNWIMGVDNSDAGKFKISSSTALGTNDRLVIDGNGNVGVGVSNPFNGKLSIQTNSTTQNSIYATNPSGQARFAVEFLSDYSNLYMYDNANAQGVVLRTDGNASFIKNGNVGIGTTSPAYKLTINSTNSTDNLFQIATTTNQNIMVIDAAGNIGMGRTVTGARMAIKSNSSEVLQLEANSTGNTGNIRILNNSNYGYGVMGVVSGTGGLGGDVYGLGYTPNGEGVFTNVLNWTSGGNVGIGTSSPGATLDVLGALCVDDATPTCGNAARTAGTIYAVATAITGIDVAEQYPTKDAALEAGDIVMLDPANPVFVAKATSSQAIILGAVSTNPGVLLGGYGGELYSGERMVSLALAGRIPVKVNLENGPIVAGDKIALSSVPGIGAKAKSSGTTVGIALESFDESKITDPESGVGKVLVIVNLAYEKLDTNISNYSSDSSSLIAPINAWAVDQQGGVANVSFFGTINMQGNDIVDVGAIRGMFSKWSIDAEGNLAVKSITVDDATVKKSLKVGEPGHPSGFTLYDRQTGQPSCVTLSGGALMVAAGECAVLTPPAAQEQGLSIENSGDADAALPPADVPLPEPSPVPPASEPVASSTPPTDAPPLETNQASTTP